MSFTLLGAQADTFDFYSTNKDDPVTAAAAAAADKSKPGVQTPGGKAEEGKKKAEGKGETSGGKKPETAEETLEFLRRFIGPH